MSDKSLDDLFKQAADIAGRLPENLQEAAFNRALDHLLGESGGGRRSPGLERETAPTRVRSSEAAAVRSLLEKIDRTRYPDVGATTRVADRALKVLQLANDDHNLDGLSAQEISEVLTKKFRLPVRPNAVNMALERETGTVDVRQKAGAKVFHLMAPGEAYLKRLRDGEVSGERRSRATQPNKKQTQTRSLDATATHVPTPKEESAKKAPRASGSRPGPKKAVQQLISEGFFDAARTIADIQERLKHKRGHTYTLQDLSPTLVRLLRDGSLSRERNTSGQYEYTKN